MTTIINTKLGVNKNGKKRLWLEGGKLLREGVTPGAKYDLDFRDHKLVIRICADGQYTVSRRERAGKVSPIIDLVRHEIAALFEGVDVLRVCVRNGLIVVSAHQQIDALRNRVEAIKKKILNGESLTVCSLFHGGGILDKAIHHGLLSAGISSHVEVAVEIESAYLESSLSNNPELWRDSSFVIESPLELVGLRVNSVMQTDLLVAGIPCTGASKAGRSKNKLEYAESHDTAGALFFYMLTMVQSLNPAVIILENVVEYSTTASMQVIRSVLITLGYDIQETVLDGNAFGALEKRKRLCVVALSKGVDAFFHLDQVVPIRVKESKLGDVLESIPLDDTCWRSYDYLAAKEVRDISAGKGFARQLLTGDESGCGVLGRGYYKHRSTEPFLLHPENDELSRLLTPSEHAKVKGIPVQAIAGLSATIAHQVLGQSIIFPAFEAVAKQLGESLQAWAMIDRYGARSVA